MSVRAKRAYLHSVVRTSVQYRSIRSLRYNPLLNLSVQHFHQDQNNILPAAA